MEFVHVASHGHTVPPSSELGQQHCQCCLQLAYYGDLGHRTPKHSMTRNLRRSRPCVQLCCPYLMIPNACNSPIHLLAAASSHAASLTELRQSSALPTLLCLWWTRLPALGSATRAQDEAWCLQTAPTAHWLCTSSGLHCRATVSCTQRKFRHLHRSLTSPKLRTLIAELPSLT